MKQKLILLGIAFALLTACSSEEETATAVVNPEEEGEVIDIPVEMSDIPIVFGLSNGTTRSAFEGDELACGNIGIFCLARQGIDGTSNNGITWNNTSASSTNNQLARWLNNEPAEIVWTGTASILQWMNGETGNDDNHFYPSAASTYKYAYTFAAYHPRLAEEHIDFTASSIYLNFTELDGSQDVFTSVTEPPTDQVAGKEGFSASYYRNGGTETPFFNLKHRLSKIIVNIKLNDTYTGGNLWVDSVYITSLPDSVRIPFLSITKATGVISESSTVYVHCTRTKTYFLRDLNDKSLRKNSENYLLTTSLQQIGDCILIPPMQSSNMKYNGAKWSNATAKTAMMTLKVRVRLKDIEGNYYVYGTSVAPPTNGWKQGKAYNVNLSITPKGATNIAMAAEAQLIGWEPDTDEFTSDYDVE